MMNKIFKRKPKEINSAIMKSEIGDNFGSHNNNPDNSFLSYQSNNNNVSFSLNHTPLDSDPENLDFPQRIPLNQNFSSLFNVPVSNKKVFA